MFLNKHLFLNEYHVFDEQCVLNDYHVANEEHSANFYSSNVNVMVKHAQIVVQESKSSDLVSYQAVLPSIITKLTCLKFSTRFLHQFRDDAS